MCGRFILTSPGRALAEQFDLPQVPELEPRYNIAPTQEVAVIRLGGDENCRQLTSLRWGLIPFWAKDATIGSRLINARSETLEQKPAFRSAFKSRRLLIPANGFYEWKKTDGKKLPYLIELADRSLFAFAGLWEHWKTQDDSVLETCTIITTEANELIQPIHERMPVILDQKDYTAWLDPTPMLEQLEAILRPYPPEEMDCHPVSTKVNKATYDAPDCIAPILDVGLEP